MVVIDSLQTDCVSITKISCYLGSCTYVYQHKVQKDWKEWKIMSEGVAINSSTHHKPPHQSNHSENAWPITEKSDTNNSTNGKMLFSRKLCSCMAGAGRLSVSKQHHKSAARGRWVFFYCDFWRNFPFLNYIWSL